MTSEDFKKQFLPHAEKLYALAFRLLNNKDEASDAVQDTFLKLWNKRNELEIQNTEAFCVTLVKNICLDILRKRRRNEALSDIEQIETEKAVNKQIEIHYDWLQIQKLIKQLPQQQQQLIILRHVKEYTMTEIAQQTGLSEANVRTTLSRARKLLRENFEKLNNYGYKRN
ncbi:MAG: sigma-70 family RNA polymerase sigma factor [Prevotellaceae bacterium]|jgi:RNA polymerase sigma-70 factor (ECF subfamily)|nr:sigma-70 family RNA polymerase sigma factor [Prevotellaceae bacterium]